MHTDWLKKHALWVQNTELKLLHLYQRENFEKEKVMLGEFNRFFIIKQNY